MYRFMAESGCKCKSLSIHRPDTSGYLMYHTSNLCIIHQILCIGTISSDTSCIIHQILDVYLHLHPDERLALNFAVHILYSDTAYTAIHGDTAYRMYHPPSVRALAHVFGRWRALSAGSWAEQVFSGLLPPQDSGSQPPTTP